MAQTPAAGHVSVGEIVRELRREKGWTQEQLGRKAGYKAGAGVSISRFETGQVEPSRRHLEGIATALGLSIEGLMALAGPGRARKEGSAGAGSRLRRVEQELDRRTNVITDLGQAFNAAHARAKDDFLLRFVELAGRVDGDDPNRFAPGDIDDLDDAATEAAYSLALTRFGVAQALAATSGGAAKRAVAGADLAYPTFTAIVTGAAATAAGSISDPTGAMERGLGSALRVRATASERKDAAATIAFFAASSFAVGMVAALWKQQRNRKELQRQLDSTLDSAETELEANQPNFEALQAVLPGATDLLEYVAVHAGHALGRWDAQLGSRATLGAGDRARYDDFVEIAAAQLAVANLDLDGLTELKGGELSSAVDVAHQTLDRARSIIASRV